MSKHVKRLFCHGLLLALLAFPAVGTSQDTQTLDVAGEPEALNTQESNANQTPGDRLQYVAPKTVEMLIGVRIQAGDGNMLNNLAMTVFPTSWPEQKVEVVQVNVPPHIQYSFRDLPGGNQQLLFQSQLISARSLIEATVQVRIEKSHIIGPQETTDLVIPRRMPAEAKQHLGNSPFIEATSSEIKKIVRDIESQEPLCEWNKIEKLYDWVRENIQYENGDLKTVREALRDRTGDCEELTGTFVALCRAARVPARCVWIPNHCYAEFFLEDSAGNGYWFPCQLAGTRNFGSMPEYLPILQKGDRFKVPEKKELQRYLADYLSSQKVLGRTKPQVEFVRQLLGDAANLPAPDQGGAANLPAPDQGGAANLPASEQSGAANLPASEQSGAAN